VAPIARLDLVEQIRSEMKCFDETCRGQAARDRLNGVETDAACEDFRGLPPSSLLRQQPRSDGWCSLHFLIVFRGLFKRL
jgi:hypothetical protein